MLYHKLLLGSDAPLANVWLSAHFIDYKVKKKAILKAKLADYIQMIVHPQMPLTLKISTYLSFGVVRIFSRKIGYLLNECKQFLAEINLYRTKDDIDININIRRKKTTLKVLRSDNAQMEEIANEFDERFMERVGVRTEITIRDHPVNMGNFDFTLDEVEGDGNQLQLLDESFRDLLGDESRQLRDGRISSIRDSLPRISDEQPLYSPLVQLPIVNQVVELPEVPGVQTPAQAEFTVPAAVPAVRTKPPYRRPCIRRKFFRQKTQKVLILNEFFTEKQIEFQRFKDNLVLEVFLDTSTLNMDKSISRVPLAPVPQLEIVEDVGVRPPLISVQEIPDEIPVENFDRAPPQDVTFDQRQYLSDITNQHLNFSMQVPQIRVDSGISGSQRSRPILENLDTMVGMPSIIEPMPVSLTEQQASVTSQKRSPEEVSSKRKKFRFFDDLKRNQHTKCEERSMIFAERELIPLAAEKGTNTIDFQEVEQGKNRADVARDFLSLLYLQKNQKIKLEQKQCFDTITITI